MVLEESSLKTEDDQREIDVEQGINNDNIGEEGTPEEVEIENESPTHTPRSSNYDSLYSDDEEEKGKNSPHHSHSNSPIWHRIPPPNPLLPKSFYATNEPPRSGSNLPLL
jgi:hypothetical protein